MTNTEKDDVIRQEFEKWCINNCCCSLRKIVGYDNYDSNKTRFLWNAFKAGWKANIKADQ